MKILLVGGGGREHAIAWKLAQSPLCTKLFCAPGNAGIARVAELVPIAAADVDAIALWAARNGMDFVVVASDDPLALGLVDKCKAAGLRAFGPSQAAAELEWSKVFSKGLMKKYNIPTAEYEMFTDCESSVKYAKLQHPSAQKPVVIKADGLALGKGVIIARSADEAEDAIRDMMEGGRFAASGRRVVVEEFLRGREVTVLCFTDGETVVPMPASRDHKRAFDGDLGPNTGGMGVITPVADYTPEFAARCMDEIFLPTVRAMKAEGRPFAGVLYFELMLTPDGPKVIEYNARFGDPEAQAILPLLESDLLDIMLAVEDGNLRRVTPVWTDAACACVVMASGGYPGDYPKGLPIAGIESLSEDMLLFHAGTARDTEGRLVTAGGRVLALCATGNAPKEALERVYGQIDKVTFNGAFYRRDIGKST
ncbi:MAG: phosphoribosylamine--glycine ligase [Oscillospiraceae bacterium]|nr:phosphoribosylamine--glycine ligase [Oscillospiraceae bacterium]